MKLFTAAARLGSLSAAARANGLSAASASRQISALEAHLRVRLLNRGPRSLTLTEAGDILLQRVRPLIEEFDAALDAVEQLQGEPRGLLRVHARSVTASRLIAPALPRFLEQYPDMRVELLVSNEEHVDVVRGAIDVDIRYSRPDSLDLVAIRLGAHSMDSLLVASPAYLQRHGAPQTPEDLGRHNCVTYGEPVWRCERAGEPARQVEVRSNLRTNDGAILRLAALDGVGIAIVPRWAVDEDLASGALVPVLPDVRVSGAVAAEHIFAVYQRSRYQSAKLRAFLRFLQEVFAAPTVEATRPPQKQVRRQDS